ncbi:MAG: hypothetical protein PHO37_15605 [Kiritimatiellae bacterium]|nr:hypothetical protein [Kiritimatiellia bacterium]
MHTKNRRFTRSSDANVFVGNDKFGRKVSWSLDVDSSVDMANGAVDSAFFLKRRHRNPPRYRNRLFHYIAAGGIRQLKRTTLDDLVAYRKRRFVVWMVILALFWLVFYLLPSV